THDDELQDKGIEDGDEEVVKVVTTAKMLIYTVVDAVQVTIAITDIPVSVAKTIVTTTPTITVECTKKNVEVTQAPKRKGVMIQELEETTTTKTTSSQQPQTMHCGKHREWCNLPKTQVVEGVTTEMPITTVEEKAQKRLEKLLEDVEKIFGGNAARKKTKRNILKQQYKNFTTPSSEMLDQILIGFKSLNKADLDTMSIYDLYNNLKLYELEVKGMSSSSSSTQNMAFVSSSNNKTSNTNGAVNTAQAVNTAHEVSTTSTQVNAAYSIKIDNLSDAVIFSFFASQPNSPQLVHEDLEQIHPNDMKEMDLRWQMAMLTMRARSAKTTIRGDILLGSAELQEIKTTSTRKAQVGVCMWKHLLLQLWCHVMVLVDMIGVIRQRKDQIKHLWLSHLQVLTQRARRFLKRIERKLTVSGNETISFDKSNMECYNCHKREHFARECRALRNQDNKHKEISRRSVPMKTSNSIALVSCDGLGGDDWSDQEEEGPNYALMTFSSLSSDSKVSNDSTYLKSCLETVKLLKSQNEQLSKDLNKSELMVLGYKTSLVSVEERLKFFKTNKSIYLEDIKVLKVELQMGEIAIKEIRKKLEIAQKEKDGIQLNVKKFENASKNLNKLIECQIVDNCKKRLGFENYNVVPPPYTVNFMPLTPDLSFTGLDEFLISLKLRIVKAKSSEEETKIVRKNDDAPIIEEWVSDNEKENMSQPKIEKKTVRPNIVKKEFVKSKQQKKTARKTVKQVEHHRQNTHSPRGN
nr:hypothetical protein [Tanacetum cinerariifolium]